MVKITHASLKMLDLSEFDETPVKTEFSSIEKEEFWNL